MKLNEFVLFLKEEIEPLLKYIKENIFKNQSILSQELIIHKDKNILALCDLSNADAILEIKTFFVRNFDKLSNQLFYESNGRDCYVMEIDWFKYREKISFIISKIEFTIT